MSRLGPARSRRSGRLLGVLLALAAPGLSGTATASTVVGAACTTDADCEDWLYCTGPERCLNGRCANGMLPCPSDGIACTTDTCSEYAQQCRYTPPDADGDGHWDAACIGANGAPLGDDCDDRDPTRYPGATEICDGNDEDCDPATLGTRDNDKDGVTSSACCNQQPGGAPTKCGADCNDGRPDVGPYQMDVCDGLNNDCKGAVDDGETCQPCGRITTVYADDDRDGFGNPSAPMSGCARTTGVSTLASDCDDTRAAIGPGSMTCTATGVSICGSSGAWAASRCGALEQCVVQPTGTGLCSPIPRAPGLALGSTTTGFVHGDGSIETFGSVSAAPLSSVTVLAVGGGHACALRGDATVWCWGRDDRGQLGDGAYSAKQAVQVSAVNGATTVAAGPRGTCASNPKATYCWGAGTNGELGNGVTADSNVPVEVAGLGGSRQLAVGTGFTCALGTDQTVRCWGDNGGGALGDGTLTSSAIPVVTQKEDGTPLGGVVSVAVGSASACAVDSGGATHCWGSGKLGNGSVTTSLRAVRVKALDGRNIAEVAMGADHTCVREGKGAAVLCWGNGGQLGDGVGKTQLMPVEVAALGPARSLRAGGSEGFHTCAALVDETVWCWGENGAGQLADTTTTARLSPVQAY